MFRKIRKACYQQCSKFCRLIFCNFCAAWKKRKRQSTADSQTEKKAKLNHFPTQKLVKKRAPTDQVSEAGTFEGLMALFYFKKFLNYRYI